MRALLVMFVCLILVGVPVAVYGSTIIWQDNFNEYYEGMPLEESPDWDKISTEYGEFIVYVEEEDDLYVVANYAYIYIASGGANNPEMKVSAGEAEADGPGDFGASVGVATRLFYDGSCYLAIYWHRRDFVYGEFQGIEIDACEAGDYPHTLVSMEIPSSCGSISITASEENPVHLSAWFGSYHLTYDDYIYNLTGGYGGIYAECTMGGFSAIDDFSEEEIYNVLQPTSLGHIKTLMR